MKKTISIIILVVMLMSILCGCHTKTTLLSENHVAVKQEIAKHPKPVYMHEIQEALANENQRPVQQEQAVRPVKQNINPATRLWHHKEMIEFTIGDATYRVGDGCGTILSDFETVKVVDGCINDDGTVRSGEKVSILLKDEHDNQFLVVIRNDFDQNMPKTKCTLHEILVETELFDMSNLTIQSHPGNMTLVEWVITLGEHYGDYSYDDNTCYSWEVEESCYLDVCAIDNDVQYIQLMTY